MQREGILTSVSKSNYITVFGRNMLGENTSRIFIADVMKMHTVALNGIFSLKILSVFVYKLPRIYLLKFVMERLQS